MPAAQTERIRFLGRLTCICVVDAFAEYSKVTGGKFTAADVMQLGYNYGGVAASAGTHDRGGVADTVSLSSGRIKSSSAIGMWPNNRTRAQGFIPHNHMIVFGCPHMSLGLAWQESELRAGRNGLAGRGRDPHKSLRPSKIVTFRQHMAAKYKAPAKKSLIIGGRKYTPITTVSVKWINRARSANPKYVSRHVYWLQVALRKAGFYKSTLDGKWGKVTQAALDSYRRNRMKLSGSAATGSIGYGSLSHLFKATKSSLKVSN